MSTIYVGNAPCSWGTLEFEGMQGKGIGYAQMLDELAETGYTGTELGDWGYMPTDPKILRKELDQHQLALTGAFVPVNLAEQAAHAPGEAEALKVASLLATVATDQVVPPFLVLADENGRDPARTRHAGRITAEMALSDTAWRTFAQGAERIARAVQEKTGLHTVFHHHCAGYVETPAEIDHFLSLTDPALVGLVFDTGHFSFGAGCPNNLVAVLDRLGNRIWYIHFKDCDPDVTHQACLKGWDYFEAVHRGVFCELGKGCVDFPAALSWLRERDYQGYVTVEQDVLPGMGAPMESALRNRQYLRSIGL
jgi:inosose dehydratase